MDNSLSLKRNSSATAEVFGLTTLEREKSTRTSRERAVIINGCTGDNRTTQLIIQQSHRNGVIRRNVLVKVSQRDPSTGKVHSMTRSVTDTLPMYLPATCVEGDTPFTFEAAVEGYISDFLGNATYVAQWKNGEF